METQSLGTQLYVKDFQVYYHGFEVYYMYY